MMKHIGRSQRSSTTGFVFGCAVPEPDVPLFGSFVKAPIQKQRADAIGLIYNIMVEDDQFVRQMIASAERMADEDFEAYLQDQRTNRQVPIEVSVLTVGYRSNSHYYYTLPPQPPITLDKVHYCTPDEVINFTQKFDFLRLILEAPDVPADELIAVALLKAAEVQPNPTRFLTEGGRELARLLSRDLTRLQRLLQRITPPQS